MEDYSIIFTNKYFGENFHVHPNLFFHFGLADSFPEFYKQIIVNWSTYFESNSEVLSCIQSNFLWYSNYLLTDNKPVYLQSFADKNVNFFENLLDFSGNFKSWNELKTEFNLADNLNFSWMQLINSIALNWRNIFKSNCSSTNLLLMNHQLVKKNNLIISLGKFHFQELSNMLVYISSHKPTS